MTSEILRIDTPNAPQPLPLHDGREAHRTGPWSVCFAAWMLCVALCVAWAAGIGAADFGAAPLTNADIISYTQSRVASTQIIDKINTSETNFDLSPEAVVNLKHNGVPDDVLAVMTVAASRSSAERRAPPRLDVPSLTPLPNPFATAPAPVFSQPPAQEGNRFQNELAMLATGSTEAADAALGWMMANRNQALPLLRDAVVGANAAEQAAAVLALGKLKDQSSLDVIRRLLTSPSQPVRRNAALALAEMDDGQTIAAAEKALTQPGVSPLDGYIRLVGAARLVRASRELGVILANNPAPVNRAAAAWALAEIGPPAAVAGAALENALVADADPDVRREAARGVASLHNPKSAALLKNACRKDPAVRKTTLIAMADYPETVEFLISVMKLGSDQIAADELDAARLSLQKLTGQDFALDGDRWSQWYENNASSMAATTAAPAAAADAGFAMTDLSSLLGSLESGQARLAAQTSQVAQTPHVDVTAWGIVVDPLEIPMAPEVEAAVSRGAGIPAGFPAPEAGAWPEGAGTPSLSPHDFPSGPVASPGIDEAGPTDTAAGIGPEPAASPFRTWSSDASRVAEPEGPPAGPAVAQGGTAGPQLAEGETQLWSGAGMENMFDAGLDGDDGMFSSFDPGADPGGYGPEPMPQAGSPFSSLPSTPIVSPATGQPATEPDPASALRGIALPLPGMSGFAGDAAPAAPAAPPMAVPAVPVPTPSEEPAAMASPFGSGSDIQDEESPSATEEYLWPAEGAFPAEGMGMEPDAPVAFPEFGGAGDFPGGASMPDLAAPSAGGFPPFPSEGAEEDDWGRPALSLPGQGEEPSGVAESAGLGGMALPLPQDMTRPAPPMDDYPAPQTGAPLQGLYPDADEAREDGPPRFDPAFSLGQEDSPADGLGIGDEAFPGGAEEPDAPGEAIAPEADDYETILFPDDGFGIGASYFDQVEAAAAQPDTGSEGESDGPSPLGGLMLPLPTETSPATPAEPPAVYTGIRPPEALMQARDEDEAGPDAAMPPAAGATESDDLAPTTTTASSGNLVFVEPEPGQVVIGDDLFSGMPLQDREAEEYAEPGLLFDDESFHSPEDDGTSFPDMPEGLSLPVDQPDDGSEPGYVADSPLTEAEPDSPREAFTRPASEETGPYVLEVEELGVIGDDGDIVSAEEHGIVLGYGTVDAGSETGSHAADDNDDGKLISEVWEGNEEAAEQEAASSGTSRTIPEGIPVLSEDEIYTDPGPGEIRESGAPSPVQPENASPRRRRNPPRHRR